MSKKKQPVPPRLQLQIQAKDWSPAAIEGFRRLLKGMGAFDQSTPEEVASDEYVRGFAEGVLEIWAEARKLQ